MIKGKPYIAFLLFAVYAFSIALPAGTGFTIAGLEVKKECPNKGKFKRIDRQGHTVSFSLVKKNKPSGNHHDDSHTIEICNNSSPFISAFTQFEPITISRSKQRSELPYLYKSPTLQKRIDPPRQA